MAEFYDISAWNEKPWFQTGGTRSKVIVENPSNHKDYYFKTSLKKERKDYKYEFWSEIIASEVGALLGFDILRYDIAYKRNEIGCISESMVSEGKNKLTEGISYLTGFDTSYNPKQKDSIKQYTFQLISNTLNIFGLNSFIENIIQLIIFDSIIGNGDRHQENWGIITEYNEVIKRIEDIAGKKKKNNIEKILFWLIEVTSKLKKNQVEHVLRNTLLLMPGKFSPIYDSGSSLGREIEDHKVKQMLTDPVMMGAYVQRGNSEIHWKGKKLNHFELIQQVKNEHQAFVIKIIEQVKNRYTEKSIRNIVENIDTSLPDHLTMNKLPTERKEFIIKLITLRIQKLVSIIQ